MILDLIAITLASIHFGVPLLYYHYMRTKWLNKPWGIKTNPNYEPKITIIIPTYNEASLIQEKLDNIYEQVYPREKIEVIVIDSASIDGTPQLVKEWARKHPDLNLKLIQEPERKGKAIALNKALKHATGEIIIITDADAIWPNQNTLRETIKWLSDPIVGAVSCIKQPTRKGTASIEKGYRQYYNTLRIAESKAWSTPIFHGELAAFKKNLLMKIGGFPTDIGADDSHTATLIALQGKRSIIPENIRCIEAIPLKNYHTWRIRRAQHLIQHFWKILLSKQKPPRKFKFILYIEVFLHLINPWLLLATIIISIISLIMYSKIAIILLVSGISLLILKFYRTWISMQAYLIVAMIRNQWTKEIAWKKQYKNL